MTELAAKGGRCRFHQTNAAIRLATMESFWGSLKNELMHHQRYATRADAQVAIQDRTHQLYSKRQMCSIFCGVIMPYRQ
ncbi:IS3 family transposase [Duganella sp. FT3S]|uniref:IS3 family transposase n=1 Tax=Rugamonas fusca TaxID=2758568 RepID=A0A7W2EHW5_9BURK|nr:IS3 family transposase [Rugamonas fusca]